MKNIHILITMLFSVFVFTQCKDKVTKDWDKASADASYDFYTTADTTKLNPDSIKITDKVIFKSQKNLAGGNSYVLYTSQAGNKYTPYYNMKDSNQANRSIGIVIPEKDKKFISEPVSFLTPGTYKIYMIATGVLLKDGRIKRDIDSSRTITVYDPNSKVAKLLTFGTVVPSPITAIIDEANAKIQFLNLNPLTQGPIKFNKCYITFTATGSKLYADTTWDASGKNLVSGYTLVNVSTTKLKLTNGSKIKVEANTGGATKEYTVEIKYLISSDSTIKSASIKNVASDFPFSATATISGSTITLPSWPKGTSQFILTVNTTGVTPDKTYTIQKSAIGTTIITSTAQNGTSKMNYSIVAPTTEFDATVSAVTISSTSSYISKQIGNNYLFSLSNAADLAIAKLKIDTKTFATIQFDTLSTYTTMKPFTSASTITDFSKHDTIYFKVSNGTDVKNFFVKMTSL
jgi:hypothetical protein